MHKRHLHHFLSAIAAVALLALGSPWATGAAADAAQVTVVSPGGAAQTLALDALTGSEDVADRAYTLRSAAGESSQTVTGFSLARLLEAAGADPYGFSYLEVQRPAGGTVLLSHDQALDAGAFADGPPVVYSTTTGTAFLRPNAGPEDPNADDSFEAPQGISIVLSKGTQLQVKAKASARKVKVGQKVSFSATVQGAGAGEQLSYSWYFDDGSPRAEGSAATHSFAKRGGYDVVVGVTTPGNETGTSAVVTVQVGPLVDGGPNRKGGGTNQAINAPDHGAADGPSTGTTSLGTTGSPTYSGEGTVGGTPLDTQRDRRERVQRGTADRPPTGPAGTPPPGEQVEGELLSTSGTAAPEVEKQQRAARTGNLDGDGGDGSSISTAAAGLLVTLGLLGAGALIEARRLPGSGACMPLSGNKSTLGGRR
jgi:hypothetical protein